MAMRPVRAISRTPNGRRTSSRPSILSTVPETSRISDSGATSMTRARNTFMSSIRCGRDCWSAETLMSARSRSREGRSEIFSARRTSTSFSRLASRRWAPFSSVWATMVMRAISSLSVGPTVRESMLMARRRAREATRLRTPGLFSTYATSVCMLSSLLMVRMGSWLGCRFNQRGTRAANHFVERGACRNHRIDRIFLLDAEVDQNGFRGFARGANGGEHIRARGDTFAANAEGVGQCREIGRNERCGDVALIVEKFLPLADHAKIAVVDDGDLDVDFFLNDGGQLAHGHLEAAVTNDDPDFGVRLGEFGADGRRQRETHGAQTAGSNERARLVVMVILRFPHLVLADVGDHNGFAACFFPEIVDDVRGVKMAVVGKALDVGQHQMW